jgi:hypothetical protein
MVLNTGSSSLIELVLESSTIPRSLRLLDVAAQHGAVNVVRSLTKSPIGREKIPYLLQLRNQWGETALHILAALPHTASLDILRLLKECCSEGDSWATIEQLEDNWKRSAYTVAVECSNHLVLASGLLSPQSQSLEEAGEVQAQGAAAQGETRARVEIVTAEFLEAQRRFQQRRAEAEAEAEAERGAGGEEEEEVVANGIFAPAAAAAVASSSSSSSSSSRPTRAGPPLPSLFEFPLDRARLADVLLTTDEEGLTSRDIFGNTLLHKLLHWRDFEAASVLVSRAAGCGGATLQRLLQTRDGEGRTPWELSLSLDPGLEPPPELYASLQTEREKGETVKMLAALDLSGLWARRGRAYGVAGTVVHGEKRGRVLGYPTANLGQVGDQAIPPAGVYAGWLHGRNVQYPAAISVGDSPSFEGQRAVSIEAHCLVPPPGQQAVQPRQGAVDPSSAAWIDLYGLEVTVFFGHYLRGMAKYEGPMWLEDLLAQMEKDCRETERLTRGRGPFDAMAEIDEER